MPSRYIPILGGVVYHVTNRARDGLTLFDSPRAYGAFVELIAETHLITPIRVLALCVMSNHWHFVLWPEHVGQVEAFVGRLSLTPRETTASLAWLHRFWSCISGPIPRLAGRVRPQPVSCDPLRRTQSLRGGIDHDAGRLAMVERVAALSDPAVVVAGAASARTGRTYVGQAIESDELQQIRERLKEEPLRRRSASVRRFDW